MDSSSTVGFSGHSLRRAPQYSIGVRAHPRHEVDVEVRHTVAEHERIHVLCIECVAEDPRDSAHQPSDETRLVVGQAVEACDMSFGFYGQPSPVCRWTSQRVNVPDIRAVVFVEDAALRGITQPVLVADEAISA